MSKENVSQKFRLENVEETRNYLIEKINQNELMIKKHKKVYRALNYIEHLFILILHISFYEFASLVGIPIRIMSSAIGLTTCVITVGIKKYYSIIK